MLISPEDEQRRKDSYDRLGLPRSIDNMASCVTTVPEPTTSRSIGGLSAFPSSPSAYHHPSFEPSQSHLCMSTKKYDNPLSASNDLDSNLEIQPEFKKSNIHKEVRPQYLWDVDDSNLPKVPQFYPIEKTAILVQDTSATIIAKRIADCLFHRSIESVFVSNSEKVKAKCITTSNIEFRIRLYRPRKDDYSHSVIVEIQRRSGFDTNFYRDSKAILECAQGNASIESHESLSSLDQEETEVKRGYNHENSTLLIAGAIFEKSKSLDSQVIALKLLASLTDSEKVGKVKAAFLSSQLFRGDFYNRMLILNTILSSFSTERNKVDNSILQESGIMKRILALNILSNVCKCLSESFFTNHRRTLKECVFPFLNECVQRYEFEAKTAYAYTECLRALLKHDDCPFDLIMKKSVASTNLNLAKKSVRFIMLGCGK